MYLRPDENISYWTRARRTSPRPPCSVTFSIFVSRFIVKKEAERSEVKVQEGPEGFPFLKNEKYIFKYSFRAVDGMKVDL